MGSHEVDAFGDLFKGRLTSKGDVVAKKEVHGCRHGQYWGLTRHFDFGCDNGDVRIKNMVHSGEGCGVPGYVWANRVPRNIHFWTYSHAYVFSSLCQETQDINVSHHVSCVFWHGKRAHPSFGPPPLGLHRSTPTFSSPHYFWVLSTHPLGPTFGAPPFWSSPFNTIQFLDQIDFGRKCHGMKMF